MKLLSQHFKVSEMHCKCGKCQGIEIDPTLVTLLELVRLKFNRPVIISSGYRCPTHNKNVGGVSHSKHLKGTAADIVVKGTDPQLVYDFLSTTFPNSLGLKLYNAPASGFVHVDTRTKPWRAIK